MITIRPYGPGTYEIDTGDQKVVHDSETTLEAIDMFSDAGYSLTVILEGNGFTAIQEITYKATALAGLEGYAEAKAIASGQITIL